MDKAQDKVENKTEDKKNKNQDYEIDLGQLFVKMGNSISNLFTTIFKILKFLFLQLVIFTLFIKHNAIKLAIGTLVGLLLGAALQFYTNKEEKFETSMTLSPNFGSTLQLYKSVEMLQSLIDLKEYDVLSRTLNITTEEAESLVAFEVTPYLSNIEKVKAYQKFLILADSITTVKFPFDDYFTNVSVEDYRYHIITVVSKKYDIFSKLKQPILSSIVNNKFFADIKETSYKNLISKKVNLELAKNQLDTLSNFYKKITILSAERSAAGDGTNIYLANQQIADNKELVVFNKYLSIDNDILAVTREITNEKEIVNVISDFNEFGAIVKTSYIKWGTIDGFLLTLLILLLIEVNIWMKDYVKENKLENL